MLRHLTNQSMIAESHLAALQAVRLHPFFSFPSHSICLLHSRIYSPPQGCALAEPWHLTFVLGRLEIKITVFSYKSYAGYPGFYKLRALGSLQFSLEHSLDQYAYFLSQQRGLVPGYDCVFCPTAAVYISWRIYSA